MALNELVFGFRPPAAPGTAGFESPAEEGGTLAGGGEDGDDSADGQSSAPAVEGDVVEGLGGACSGAQAGMIIGRAMREAFLAIETFLPPRGGLVSALADAGGVTPSFGAFAALGVRALSVLFFGCGGAGLSLPLLLPLACRSAAWYFCMVSAGRVCSGQRAGSLSLSHWRSYLTPACV